MNRRALLRASVVAGGAALAGCTSRETDADPGLAGVTFFVGGTVERTDGSTLWIDPSEYNDGSIEIDVSDNAGPLVGTETDGEWVYERRSDWSLPEGVDVCASVRMSDDGGLRAVKVFVNAVCSFQRPPSSDRRAVGDRSVVSEE